MTRRLTIRTLTVSALIVVIVAGVLGGLTLAIDRQHDAGERARRSQAVIAAANLTQQRLLAVQTIVRGFLIRGNPSLLRDYRSARASFPAAALELQALVERDPAQRRLAAQIHQQATRATSTTTPIRSSRARARRASARGARSRPPTTGPRGPRS